MSTDILNDAFGEASVDSSHSMEPFYKVNNKPKREKELWLKNTIEALVEQSQSRVRQQRENLMTYRGISIKKWDRDRDRVYRGRRMHKIQKYVVPLLHDLTETRISQIMRLPPAVDTLPKTGDWEDRTSAEVAGKVIDHLFRINKTDYLAQKHHRNARIFGESYIWVDFDEMAGDLHPAYVEAKDQGLEEVILPDGKSYKLDKPIKTGEVTAEVVLPWRIFLQRKPDFSEVQYAFRARIMETEKAKDRFGNKDIKPTSDLRMFDMDDFNDKLLEKHTLIWEFWHIKDDEFIPEGKHIFCLGDGKILKEEDHPFNHGKLPFTRLTDLDMPDTLNGVSKYEMLAPIQNMYNNVNTLLAKNIWLMGHAKWMMPRGTCKIEQLGNDNIVVQYQGGVAPKMAQVQPNPPEAYRYRDDVREDLRVAYGNHGISRGEIPPGITATSAMKFLNQLENERAATDIAKHGFFVVELAELMSSVAHDKYDNDDGRTIRIVGRDNQYAMRQYDVAHLHKPYDIIFDITSGLPETKAGKIQTILDAMQRNPDMLPGERWEQLLELADSDKLVDVTQAAVNMAESENNDLAAGRPVDYPEEWEDHAAHLDAHYRFMQSRQFKEDLLPERRKAFKDHVFWSEKAAIDKMNKGNPEFEAKMARIELFPIFSHPEYAGPPRSAEQQQAAVQGAYNKEGMAPEGTQIPGRPGLKSQEQDVKQ